MTMQDVTIAALQIVLPLGLLLWLARVPARNLLAYSLQVIVVGLTLLALCLVPIWLIPPWWTPFVYVVAGLVAFASHVVRWRVPTRPRLPRTVFGWTTAILLALLGAVLGALSLSAMSGRVPPEDGIVSVAFPLGAGTYLVANGGSTRAVNAHFLTLDPETDRQRAYRGQSYAVDLIELRDFGLRAPSWRPRDPAAYAIFGAPVLAPCAGEVIAARGELPDNPVPAPDTSLLEGNHVFIDCGNFGILLAHLRKGSLSVAVGDRVDRGQSVAEVGNSGQSGEPHLHIHAQRIPAGGPLLSGDPLFVTLGGRFPVRNDRIEISRQQ